MNWTGSTTCASGLSCVYSNPYYSQCLKSSSSVKATTAAATKPATTASVSIKTSASSIVKPASSSSTSPAKPSSTSSTGSGPVYKASFTHYGAGDTFGSPNCNTNTAACGFYTYPGFSAAASQNL